MNVWLLHSHVHVGTLLVATGLCLGHQMLPHEVHRSRQVCHVSLYQPPACLRTCMVMCQHSPVFRVVVSSHHTIHARLGGETKQGSRDVSH